MNGCAGLGKLDQKQRDFQAEEQTLHDGAETWYRNVMQTVYVRNTNAGLPSVAGVQGDFAYVAPDG